MIGKGSSPQREQAPQGSGHCTEPARFPEAFGQYSAGTQCDSWGYPAQDKELDLMVLVDSF